MKRQKKLSTFIAVMIIAATFLAACGGSPTQAPSPSTAAPAKATTQAAPLKKVSLMLPYIYTMSFYSTLAAKELGFFQAEGLDVEVIPGNGGAFAIQQVLAGQVDVGMANPSDVVLAAAENHMLKWFYTDKASNLFGIMALADSPINKPEDLKGKILGVTAMAGGEMPMTREVLIRAGLDLNKDLTVIPISDVPATAYDMLSKHKVDAYAASISEFMPLRGMGMQLKSVNYPEYDNLTSEGMFVTPQKLLSDRDTVMKVGRGVAKASYFCQVSPDACLAVMKKIVPEEHDDPAYARMFFTGVEEMHAYTKVGDKYTFGVNKPAHWEVIQQMLMAGTASEQAISKKIDVSAVLTDELLADINNFDYAPVAAAAQAYAKANPYPAAAPAKAATAAPAAAAATAGPLTKVTFLLPFMKSIAFYPVFVADKLGYFAKEGLQVEIQPADGSSFVVQQVAAGKAEAGLAGTSAILNAFAQNIDVTDGMRWMWSQTFPLITSKSSGIKSLADLKGKVVGIESPAGGDAPALEAFLTAAGLKPRVDVTFLPVGENVPAIIQAFKDGKIVAYSSSWNRNISFQAAGFDLVDLTPPQFAQLPAEDVAFNTKWATANPKLAAGLGRVIAKGMLAGLEKPEAMLAIMKEVAPDEHGDLNYAWLYGLAALDTVRPPKQNAKYYFGAFDAALWKTFADLSGQGSAKLTGLTNNYVAEINNFDYNAVITDATAYAAAHPYPAQPKAAAPTAAPTAVPTKAPTAAPAAAAATAGPLTKVTFLLPFMKSIAFYPVFVADKLGYFAKEGLQVEIQPADGSSFVVQQVAAGKAEAGLAGTSAILNAFAQNIDVTDGMRWMWSQTFPLITSKSSGIKSLADLKGKVVGIESPAGGDVPALEAFLTAAGLKPRVDVTFLPVGENVPAIIQAFKDGKIVAYSSSWNRNISFQAAGFDLVDLTPPQFAQLPAEDVAFNTKWATANPKLAAGLGRAIAKGMLAGLEKPEAMLAIMKEVAPDEHGDLNYAWLYGLAALDTVRPPKQNAKYYFGAFDAALWKTFADLSGQGSAKLTGLTNNYVAEINNFDYNAVIADATAYATAHPYPARPK